MHTYASHGALILEAGPLRLHAEPGRACWFWRASGRRVAWQRVGSA